MKKKRTVSFYISYSSQEKVNYYADSLKISKTCILENVLNSFTVDSYIHFDSAERKSNMSFSLYDDQFDQILFLSSLLKTKKNIFIDSLLNNIDIYFKQPKLLNRRKSTDYITNYLSSQYCVSCTDRIFSEEDIKNIRADILHKIYQHWLKTTCCCQDSVEVNIQNQKKHIYFKYV